MRRDKDYILIPAGLGGVTRRALPDGTQIKIKKLEQGSLRITKRLGPQTKTAEYIASSGESIPLLEKNFSTGENKLLFDCSEFTKKKILKKTRFSEKAKSAKDIYLGIIKRAFTESGLEIKEFIEGLFIAKDIPKGIKQAGVMKDGTFVPILEKNLETEKNEIIKTIDLKSNVIKNKIVNEPKFSSAAKGLLKVLKELKIFK